ncbi:hypothetical protein PMIN06_000774 [Paraphaeosphaeria minitans]
MAMSMLKRCSTGFTSAEPTSTSKPAVDEPRPSRTLFKQGSLSRAWRYGFIRQITPPPEQNSHAPAAHIPDAENAATSAASPENDTTAAEQKARKTRMATQSRVQSLRDFFGLPSPAFNALADTEKEEYHKWRAYAVQERDMRRRYEDIAENPADVEVMLRGWRVDHPPPRLSAPVLALATEASAARKRNSRRGGDSGLPPLAQDILWNTFTLVPAPAGSVRCRICGQGPASFPELRSMYTLPCQHCFHVTCFEEDHERWLGSLDEGARECVRCKGLKELTKGFSRGELDARIRRLGDRLLNRRGDDSSGAARGEGSVTARISRNKKSCGSSGRS